MTAESSGRRPLAILVFAAVGLVGFGVIVPLVTDPRIERAVEGSQVRASPRDSFTISSPLTLLKSPRLVLEDGTVSVAAGQGGAPSTGKALYNLLTGGGADLVLDNATLTLHWAPRLKDGVSEAPGDVVGTDFLGPIAAALARHDFATVTVRRATVVITSENGSETKLRGVEAQITSDRKSSLSAMGTFSLRGEALSFDVALARSKGETDTSLSLRGFVKGDLLAASMEGRLAPDRLHLTADAAELTIPRLREAARWLGLYWPDGRAPLAFEAKGQLEWGDGAISFENARFALDGNAASGGLSLRLAGDRPALDGTLAFESFNLAPYFGEAKPATTLAVATDWFSSIGLPFGPPSFLREIDADLRISSASVALSDQVLGRCAAAISIKDGKLLADLAEVELEHGGSGDGQLTADMTGSEPRYTLRGRLEGFDIGRAAGAHLDRPPVEGIATVAVELAAEGSAGNALLASLSGEVAIDMPEGARLGIDVRGLGGAPGTDSPDRGWAVLLKGATDVESLSARFAATSGVLTAQAVQANAGDAVVSAAGNINAAERAVDLTLIVTGREGRDGLSKAVSRTPPTRTYRLRGPWSSPSITASRGPESVGLVADH